MNNQLIIMMMPLGQMQTNCYVLGNTETKDAYVFDPGADPDSVFRMLEKENLNLKGIFLTHGHFDHILAVDAILERAGMDLPIYANRKEKEVFEMAAITCVLW